MPKFACRCGLVMNLSPIPNSYEYLLVFDGLILEIGQRLEGKAALTGEEFFGMVDGPSIQVLRCDACNRLHLDRGDGVFESYAKEET